MTSFGLSPEEAWRLTIPEYVTLVKQLNENEHRLNYRAAMIVAAIYNVNRDPKKRRNPYTPEDILGVKRQEREMTADDLMNKAKIITAQFGGKVNK